MGVPLVKIFCCDLPNLGLQAAFCLERANIWKPPTWLAVSMGLTLVTLVANVCLVFTQAAGFSIGCLELRQGVRDVLYGVRGMEHREATVPLYEMSNRS